MENQPELSNLCQALKKSIKRRFSYILDCGVGNFDPIYAISTYLHPQLFSTLSESLLAAAREEVHKLVILLKNFFWVGFHRIY